MQAILALLALGLAACVALFVAPDGPAAILMCSVLAGLAGTIISRHGNHSRFLTQVFVAGLLLRAAVGTGIYYFRLQEFFGGDALTYDYLGGLLVNYWRGALNSASYEALLGPFLTRNWGMPYVAGSIYFVLGRNMLAVQYFNAVLGAATAPVIFLCAHHIFQNLRVAKVSALLVAFFPSLILWSSQGLKDGPIVFLLALAMLATLKLGERLNPKYVVLLLVSLYCLFGFRFYILFMLLTAVVGSFLIGMRPQNTKSLARQVAVVVALGLALTYLGVLRTAGSQLETYGDLEALQRSRSDLAQSAQSGFGRDVDVSTASGALSAVPLGMIYLLFAPFPWQLASLRQSITLPEMVAWWASFPLLVLGGWFTLRYRLRQALPILIFAAMLTLAYSVFQGNVGTAYRQRSQVLVFYFIFVAVGGVLLKERREENSRQLAAARRAVAESTRSAEARRRYENWKRGREGELEAIARDITGRINF